jgi:DME family drug/metabolite transporter
VTPGRNDSALSVLQGSLIVLAMGAVFSFSGLAFRLTDDVSAWQFVLFRGFGAVAVTTAIVVWRHRGGMVSLFRSTRPSHHLAGLLLGGMSTVFIVSLEHASVAFVLFLQTLAPLAAAYFSWLLLRERVSRAVLIATAVSLVGVVIMVSATVTDTIEPLGMLAVLLPIFFGLYATLIRRAHQIDPQIPVWIAGMVLVIAGLIGSIVTGDLSVSGHDALIGLLAGSLLLAIPVTFLNLAARVVPAPETSLLLMSEVVLAPVWVWIFVDEEPAATTLIGGAIILSAVSGLLFWRRHMQRQTRQIVRPSP